MDQELKKSTTVNPGLSWPCYACVYNNRGSREKPCNLCQENTSAKRGCAMCFEPILDPN